MAHSPEQNRKKEEAMRESERHKQYAADGLPARRFKSKTEMLGEDMIKEGAKQGLHMEIE